MHKPFERRWPWLTLPRAVAIFVLPGIITFLLARYFDTVLWHELVHYVNSKIAYKAFWKTPRHWI